MMLLQRFSWMCGDQACNVYIIRVCHSLLMCCTVSVMQTVRLVLKDQQLVVDQQSTTNCVSCGDQELLEREMLETVD